MSPTVDVKVTRYPARTISFRWDHSNCLPPVDLGTDPVDIECLVGQEGLEIDAGEQGGHADAVVALAGQENEAAEIAERVDQRDDFRRQSAARPAYGLILSPPFAPVPC